MIVRTRIFEFHKNGYRNLSELATTMGISVSQIYRVRKGERSINQKFIIGAIKAFPEHTLDDLFYLAFDSPGAEKTVSSLRIRDRTGQQLVKSAN